MYANRKFAHTYIYIFLCIAFVVFDSSSVINKLNTYIKHTAGVGAVNRQGRGWERGNAQVLSCVTDLSVINWQHNAGDLYPISLCVTMQTGNI